VRPLGRHSKDRRPDREPQRQFTAGFLAGWFGLTLAAAGADRNKAADLARRKVAEGTLQVDRYSDPALSSRFSPICPVVAQAGVKTCRSRI
jgi:hypothetical protein